jgi:heme-degrading monooxygenase HmoA
MLLHSVLFKLRHPARSREETLFLQAALELESIPGVEQFRIHRQVSPKNSYTHGISMAFEDHAAFDAYCHHDLHQKFVEQRWLNEVEDFLEYDYTPFSLQQS